MAYMSELTCLLLCAVAIIFFLPFFLSFVHINMFMFVSTESPHQLPFDSYSSFQGCNPLAPKQPEPAPPTDCTTFHGGVPQYTIWYLLQPRSTLSEAYERLVGLNTSNHAEPPIPTTLRLSRTDSPNPQSFSKTLYQIFIRPTQYLSRWSPFTWSGLGWTMGTIAWLPRYRCTSGCAHATNNDRGCGTDSHAVRGSCWVHTWGMGWARGASLWGWRYVCYQVVMIHLIYIFMD